MNGAAGFRALPNCVRSASALTLTQNMSFNDDNTEHQDC